MRRLLPLLAVLAFPLHADTKPAADLNRASLTVAVEPLGDTVEGVVSRLTFRFSVPPDVPPQIPLVVQGSIMQAERVVKNFRILVSPDEHELVRTTQTLPAGETQIEARLMIPLEESQPVILGKIQKSVTIARTGKAYVASPGEGAEGVVAEGVMPESVGAVKIRTPRRDVAPNLFIVDVDVKDPVKKVEFWVEGKKSVIRNSPPFRAELDLGKLPKRVEVRAVGYDAQGRYVDADAFVVNERDTPLEVKITRTVTADGIAHIKLSIQNPKNTTITSVALYAGKNKIHEWIAAPYAVDLPISRLAGAEFLRASVVDETSYEASDLLFLDGSRFTEEIEVNLVELPVTVTDASGVPATDLKKEEFTIIESGKQQKITAFNFASNLPLSLGMLLDHSGSMKPRMTASRQAAVEFFRDIVKSGDRAFFAPFAFDPTNVAPFVSDLTLLEQQVKSSPEALGGTALYDAIATGLYRFRSVQGRKALVIISDGEDTTSRLPYEEMLSYVRAARVPLYFIGIGLGLTDIGGTSKMKALANETGGVAYFIRDVKQLKQTYEALEKDLRSQYLVSYYTESTKKDTGYRTVEVKVSRPGVRVRTIRGFIP